LPLLLLQDQFIAEYAELTVQGASAVHITGYYSPNFGGGDSEEEEDEEGEDGLVVSSCSSSTSTLKSNSVMRLATATVETSSDYC
jgi:hypothetical protein